MEDLLPLLHAHALEVNWIQEDVVPDKTIYEQLLNGGFYKIFTARQEGHLIGYAGFFVNRHPHYRNFKQAVSDIIYVRPAYRRGIGGKLIEFSESTLRDGGVDAILYYVTRKKDYSPTLIKHGYKLIEHTYAKRLAKK